MSWQAYVDDCAKSRETISLPPPSSAMTFRPEEMYAIMNDFAKPGSLAPTGLYRGGTKYMVIQGEPGAVIRGKKGSCFLCYGCIPMLFPFSFDGPGGVTVKKTKLALIIGIYDEPMTTRLSRSSAIISSNRVIDSHSLWCGSYLL
ncbi:hypothetical protein V6N13_106623 [Hibiscus sabdariffa]|uniref:Profilin n=1 Tax=Hibiscus sabdariffa TaxID=183260 RepID=A0ABR2F1A4_9ROSI